MRKKKPKIKLKTIKLFRKLIRTLAPPPKLTISQWADRYRRLSPESSAEPGLWRTDRAPYQREIMDAVSDPDVEAVVLMTSAQVGKALAIDTPIPTPDGWTRMGALVPGDKVFDENGKPCTVTFATDVMHGRDCFRITFSDNTDIIADAEHRWYVESNTGITLGRSWHGKSERNGVITTAEIARTYKQGKRNRYAIPVAGSLQTNERKLPVHPYVLGVWLGDGHSYSAQITLGNQDVEIAETIRSLGHKVVERVEGSTVNLHIDPARLKYVDGATAAVTFHSVLNGLGVLKNKHIPAIYLRSSHEQRLHLLQGLMDTDGYIDGLRGRCEFVTISKGLAEGFGELLHSLGIKHTVTEKVTHATNGRPGNRGLAYRFSFLVYDEMPIFRLKRRLERMKPREGGRASETERRRITCVEPVESVPVRCISVDSESRLYLAGKQMVPTHNTEIVNNIIGYHMDYDPAPLLLLMPTLDLAQSYSKKRLAPMIRDTPALRSKVKDAKSRDSDNTLLEKGFPGGYIAIVGANSPTGLSSRPIRVLLADEVDRFPASAGTEGDPLSLAEKRTKTFWNRKKIVVSTPTDKGISRIEKEYEGSTMEEWCLPCPLCGRLQPLKWSQIRFEDELMECRFCTEQFSEREWKAGNGQWVARNPGLPRRGFHLNALASPWERWGTIIKEFKEAKKDKEMLKVWVNTYLGEPWEDLSGDKVEEEALVKRREAYNCQVPEGVLVLTAGADVQDDRIEVEVVGWGAGKESWGIAYVIFWGDPGQPVVWKQVEAYLSSTFTYEDGEGILIACTCIDSGGHFTQETYRFTKGLEHRRVFAIKGYGGYGKPLIGKATRNNREKAVLFPLGVDDGKNQIFSRLKTEFPGPGYCHFPRETEKGYTEAYFKGLCSERKVTVMERGVPKVQWKKKGGVRNEPLDLRNYATAALEILKPDFERLEKLRGSGTYYTQKGTMSAQNNRKKRRVLSKGVE